MSKRTAGYVLEAMGIIMVTCGVYAGSTLQVWDWQLLAGACTLSGGALLWGTAIHLATHGSKDTRPWHGTLS